MADYIVNCMQEGNLKFIRNYVQTLNSVNDFIYADGENELNLLHLAVGLDSIYREQVIETLLEFRPDLNCAGKSENVGNIRPLHLTAMWGYDLTVKLLLYAGADASLRDSQGHSALDYATMFNNHLCVSLLLNYGSLNSTTSGWSAVVDHSLSDTLSITSFDSCVNAVALEAALDDISHYRRSVAINFLR